MSIALCTASVLLFWSHSVLSTFDVFFAAQDKMQSILKLLQNWTIALCWWSSLVHDPVISAVGNFDSLVHPSVLTTVAQNSIQFLRSARWSIPPSLWYLCLTTKDAAFVTSPCSLTSLIQQIMWFLTTAPSFLSPYSYLISKYVPETYFFLI